MNKKKIALLALLAAVIVGLWAADLGRFFSLEYIKSQQGQFDQYYQQHPIVTLAVFFCIYVTVAGLSLPGAAVMTLLGGALFGVFVGTIVVSFASTLGATIAFLVSRFLLRDVVQNRFGSHLVAINNGITKDGPLYLLSLRLVPAFPFFVVNLVMGLTPIQTRTFYWVSQVGMFPATVVYVLAGTQLAQLESAAGLLSPGLLLSFALLGVFPFIARYLLTWFKERNNGRI